MVGKGTGMFRKSLLCNLHRQGKTTLTPFHMRQDRILTCCPGRITPMVRHIKAGGLWWRHIHPRVSGWLNKPALSLCVSWRCPFCIDLSVMKRNLFFAKALLTGTVSGQALEWRASSLKGCWGPNRGSPWASLWDETAFSHSGKPSGSLRVCTYA